MEQELIEHIKQAIDQMKSPNLIFKNEIYKSQIVIYFLQFDSLIELKKIDFSFYELVKDQVISNLFYREFVLKKEIVKSFLDQILSTNNFIINNHEKNN